MFDVKTLEGSTSWLTEQLIASLWTRWDAWHHSDTQSHLNYHPMGESWFRLLLAAYPHMYTQTHPSTYCWALFEAPQILIRSDVWVGQAERWTPHSPLCDTFPHPHAQRLLRLFSPPRPRWLLTSPWSLFLCLCAPGEFCLNKSCLPLVLSTVVEAGRQGGRRGLGIRRLFTPSEGGGWVKELSLWTGLSKGVECQDILISLRWYQNTKRCWV